MKEPGRLQSMGLLRVIHDWATSLSLSTFMHWRRKWQPTPVFLPGESQGRGSLAGCSPWGRTESDTTEATYSSSMPLFLSFFPHIGHYSVLSRVPCAIQSLLIIYFIYSCVYMSIPVFQYIPPPFPPSNCKFIHSLSKITYNLVLRRPQE